MRAHGVDPVDREPVEQRSTPATRWPTDFDPTTLTLDRVRGVLRDVPR